VEYDKESFDLKEPREAFRFLFQLFNYTSWIRIFQTRLSRFPNELENLRAELDRNHLSGFTGTGTQPKTNKRQRTGSDTAYDGAGNISTLHQAENFRAISDKGYTLESDEEVEGWVPMNQVRRDRRSWQFINKAPTVKAVAGASDNKGRFCCHTQTG
jgi:hypothetical protein